MNCVTHHDYWGAAFGVLVFLWVALRFPFSALTWASKAKRIVEIAFVIAVVIAIWLTIRA